MDNRFLALAQPGIQGLSAYDPGHDIAELRSRFGATALIELGSNENAHGPSPRARAALLDALDDVYRYPDPLGGDLKRAIADATGLDRSQLFLGNGSHELLMLIGQVFAGTGLEVVASQYAFVVYALAAQTAGARYVAVPALPAGADMPRGHDLEAMRAAIGPLTRLVYFANPNNPTGTWFSTDALDRFLTGLPEHVIAVVDEAYIEYVTDRELVSAIALLDRHPNLVVTRTFSKAHGLAGLRVGYACAHPDLLQVLERPRESFNVNIPGLAACAAAIGDSTHIANVRDDNRMEREWLAAKFAERNLRIGPSQTNFLLLDFDRPAAPIEAGLLARGVVVRPMRGYGLPTCIRVTVGARQENEALLEALDGVFEEALSRDAYRDGPIANPLKQNCPADDRGVLM